MVKIFFYLLSLLVVGGFILCTKALGENLDRPKLASSLHKKHGPLRRYKIPNTKEKCTIFCPFVTGLPSTTFPTTKFKDTGAVVSSTSISVVGIRRYVYHDLNSHQKRLILKQLNLANKHGKKSYKLNQISPSLCRVVCLKDEAQPLNTPTTTTTKKDSTTAGNENSDEDSYEEGEDKPIEATVKPFTPQSLIIGGIRPFGIVNFNGMDDFGPVGEPARDVPQLNDKHVVKHSV